MEPSTWIARPTHPWVAEGKKRIRFAIVGGGLPEWSQLVEFVQNAEEMGFDAYWSNDHPTRTMDCYTSLTGLAMATKKIRLMTLVSCIYYHSPAMIARMAADVDRVSNGRMVLGIGIGDDTEEFEQLRIPFPKTAERQAALEEAITIVQGLWQPEPFSFQGQYFQVENAGIRLRPVQQPHVPILLAGGGERVTLRQVAQYADMSNFGAHAWAGSAFELADVQRKYAVLRRYCDEIGRPYDSILRSYYTPLLVLAETQSAVDEKMSKVRLSPREVYTPFAGTPKAAIAHYQAIIDAGAQYFLATINSSDTETAKLLAEQVIPELRLHSED